MFDMNTGWGGSATVLRALHGALGELGHRVDVASGKRPDPFGMSVFGLPLGCDPTFGPEKRSGETTIDEIDSATLRAMDERSATVILDSLTAGDHYDLILANHINVMALAAQHLSRALGAPYRIISYGTDTQLLLRDQRYRALFGDAARDADRIFTISAYVAAEVNASVGGRVEVLGGAVDKDLFFPPQTQRTAGKSLIFVGRLVSEKGLWPLLRSFELQSAASELKIAGEGPLRPEIEARLRTPPLHGRVRLLGYMQPPALRAQLIASDVAVVPSIWQEPLGLVALEALACGLPVIATTVGGIPETIRDGVTGLLVPPDDATALAAAIDRLLGDAEVYRRMAAAVAAAPVPSYRDLARRVIG
jgi:glycosyltransferase involved in cell wall biosynthesis